MAIKQKPANTESEKIKAVISLFDDVQNTYTNSYQMVNTLDKETQDLLHSFELANLDENESRRLTTRLKHVRRERRRHKDLVEASDPIIQFLQSDKGKNAYNLLREVLGKTRKIEEFHKVRYYTPRIRKDNSCISTIKIHTQS